MGEVPRLKIPGVRFSDGPRGCVMGNSTAFPVAMARAATWDEALEERVGRAIGRECKALGANQFGGICINLPRHPSWGRIQETYGEDPIILGKMATAVTKGVQENVMGCLKHLALNSMENARFKVDVQVDDDVLHEVYLPHFRHVVEQGIASVMSAYNSVRGQFAGQSRELLMDILRDRWGFKGFVVEDFLFGFRDQRAQHLEAALINGDVSQSDVDRAGRAILRSLIENEVLRGDSKPTKDVIFCGEHRSLARESATRSMVLLKNDAVNGRPLLPLGSDLSTVAVVGWQADSKNTGDKGSSHVRCPEVISPFQGIKEALPHAEIVVESSNDISRVKRAAASADAVVVVVGYDFHDEGEYTAPAFNATPALRHVIPPDDDSKEARSVIERLMNPAPKKGERGKDNYGFGTGGDRRSLCLRPDDVAVIKAATMANPRTIVSIVAGGTVIVEEWKDLPSAIIFGWYSGCKGGCALADLLLGKANFSGRIPFCIPTCEEHLPKADNDAEAIKYDRWYGQRLLDRLQVPASFPLGFGLSYTTFSLADLRVDKSGLDQEQLIVRLRVSNTGAKEGRYIAQVYGVVEVPEWPKRSLLGYGLVDLASEEEKDIEFMVSTRPLQRWKSGSWALASRLVEIEVGGYSGDESSLKLKLEM
ncbi:hypothetical protein BFJ69_g13387 [Fusarium oxysporum]|uniref:beta-glucosidase n=1 Tax=Fusarium oxysporum TaxID=5507 RepID=A0A420ML13_FUSOX|nr:hypothetical protein BFJ69_g13387 [Fusarium oxysporum]